MMDVAVLFARHDSIYKSLPGCDVWDIERDARTWPGGTPIVAHPPCRSWGTFRHVAKPVDGERELALWAVDQIRRYGGVLEHPARSALWREKPLPEPGQRDDWGGVDPCCIPMVVGSSSRESDPSLHRRMRAFGAACDTVSYRPSFARHCPVPTAARRHSKAERTSRLATRGKRQRARGDTGSLRLLVVPSGTAMRSEALT